MTARRTQRGMSMAIVLMVAAVVAILALSLAALAASQVTLSHQFESDRAAQGLAEGLVAEAMTQLHEDPSWGKNRTESLRTQPDPQTPSRFAVLTFASHPGQPYCTNNWDGNSPVGYGNAEVPPGNTHLWVQGHADGVVRAVEVMVSVPQSPFALEADGAFSYVSGLTVAGAQDLEGAVAIALQNAPSQMPASIGSNASIHGEALCTISGNVDSPGTTDLPEGSTIGGTLRTDPIDVPAIDPTQYDPSSQPDAVQIKQSSLTNPPPIQDRRYTTGSLTVHGDLVLQNGLLYVSGDLVVTGAVHGHGMVAATGSVRIQGSTDITGPVQETALVTSGDVSLGGNFVGMLSTQGTLSASGGTLIGSFIASGAHSGMSLDSVTAIYVPDSSQFMLQSQPGAQDMPGFVQPGSVLLGPLPGLTIRLDGSSDANTVATAMQQLVAGQPYSYGTVPVNSANQLNPADARLYHPLPLEKTSAIDLTTATSLLRVPGQPIARVLVRTGPAFQYNAGSGWGPIAGSGWTAPGTFANPVVTVNGAVPPSVVQVDVALQHYNHTAIGSMVAALYQAQLAMTQLLAPKQQQQAGWQYDMSQNQFKRQPLPLSITSWRDH